MRLKRNIFVGLLVAGGLTWFAGGAISAPVDLGEPFTCPDVSPTAMRITDRGLVVSGITYPLISANTSSIPGVTNSTFGSNDGLIEIDVMQTHDGDVNVSYIRLKARTSDAGTDIDSNKVFERGSSGVDDPPPYFHSSNKGCRN